MARVEGKERIIPSVLKSTGKQAGTARTSSGKLQCLGVLEACSSPTPERPVAGVWMPGLHQH